MKKALLFPLLIALMAPLSSRAQYEYMDGFSIDHKNRHDKIIEIQGFYGSGYYAAGIRLLQMYRIDLEKKWHWGIGGRIMGGYAVGGNYLTASPAITRKSKAIMAVLSEPDPFSTDTLIPSRIIGAGGSIQLLIQRNIDPRLEVSFLMDLGGVNISLPTNASVMASGTSNPAAVSAIYSLLSLNFFSDHSRGNIKYEILGRYWLSHKWAISGGPMFMFHEITSTSGPVSEALRFRRKQWGLSLALVWAPFHRKYTE